MQHGFAARLLGKFPVQFMDFGGNAFFHAVRPAGRSLVTAFFEDAEAGDIAGVII